MSNYELMYIIDMQLEEGPRKELIDRINTLITGNGGTIDKIDEWGKRRLAYAINYKTEGYYVLVNFTSGSELPREIERVLQISESVLRYLVVRLEEKRTSVKPRAVPVRPAFSRPPVYEPEGDTGPVEVTAAPEPAEPAEPVPAEAPAAEEPAAEEVAAPVETVPEEAPEVPETPAEEA